MLDEKDLQSIQILIDQSISQSEANMTAKMTVKIEESEAKMTAKIEESEAKMTAKIEESEARIESHMAALIEAKVMPMFDLLVDGQKLLRETLAPKSRVEELEEEVAFLKPIVMSMLTDIDKLKKAQ